MEVRKIIEEIRSLDNSGLSTNELLFACQIGVLSEIADELKKIVFYQDLQRREIKMFVMSAFQMFCHEKPEKSDPANDAQAENSLKKEPDGSFKDYR